MHNSNILDCPLCHNNYFVIKYESTFVYSYVIDQDAPGIKNTNEFLSFMYDNRDKKESKQYIECQSCGSKFLCSFNQWNSSVGLEELQSIINAQCEQV